MKNENMYDVMIAGAGPAGLTAAIYLARACYRVLVVEKEKIGGQITITEEVVNYPGIEKTDGKSLTAAMYEFGKRLNHFICKTKENIKSCIQIRATFLVMEFCSQPEHIRE